MATQYTTWLGTLGNLRADLPPAVRGQAVSHTVRFTGDHTGKVLAGTVKASPDATAELAIWTVSAGVFADGVTTWEISLSEGQTAALPVDADGDGLTTLIYDFLLDDERLFGGLFKLSGFVTETGTIPTPPPGEPGVVLLSENNLSDVADVATARDNLGVYSTAEVDALIPAGYTDEQARDAVGAALVPGDGIDITVDDAGNTITITSTVTGGGGGSDALFFFGDGSDGDVTISSGTTTLTRDMYYNNLTISGTGQLNTANFRVHVAGALDISAAPANAIVVGVNTGTRNGGNATGQAGGTAGVTSSYTNYTIGTGASAGTAGAAGGVGAGAQASAATAPPYAVNIASGAGGAGGAVGATNGGASRAATAATQPTIDVRRSVTSLTDVINGAIRVFLGGFGGPGGSAGAGDGTGLGGGGGGGGAGGGIIMIFAKTINRGGSTAVGAITVSGGNGGNGALGNGGTNRGGGGGGAGGGGGWLYLVYKTLTGSTATDCLDATGGNGGNGGNGTGTGNGGNGGGSGAGGRIQVFDLTAGTQTITTGGASVAGSAASGGTGGAGGVATPNRVSL